MKAYRRALQGDIENFRPYEVPEGSDCSTDLTAAEMQNATDWITCAGCGRQTQLRDSIHSTLIYSRAPCMPFRICRDCAYLEWLAVIGYAREMLEKIPSGKSKEEKDEEWWKKFTIQRK